jgi:hypothetical protein
MLKAIKATAALGLALAGVPAATAAPLPEWSGRYVWEEPIGRIGGSTPADSLVAFVTYTLALGPGNGPAGCTLNGQGYQTYRRLQCTATPQGNSVIVTFYRFGPDNIGGSYPVGAPLFTMTRTPDGIVTQLQALRASSDMTPQTGRLFRRR